MYRIPNAQEEVGMHVEDTLQVGIHEQTPISTHTGQAYITAKSMRGRV